MSGIPNTLPASKESEDPIFFMFPITDKQLNFRDGELDIATWLQTRFAQRGQ